MLTREENLARAIKERNELETDISLMEEQLRFIDEEDEDYEYIDAELHNMHNEVI
jgi:hypothetical protein